jgi:hypothetical protein
VKEQTTGTITEARTGNSGARITVSHNPKSQLRDAEKADLQQLQATVLAAYPQLGSGRDAGNYKQAEYADAFQRAF